MTVTLLGGTGAAGAGTTLDLTIAGGSPAVGDDVIVVCAWNDTTAMTGVTDLSGGGNTYGNDAPIASNGAATSVAVYRSTLAGALTGGSSVIRATFGGSNNRRSMMAFMVDDLDASPLDLVPAATTANSNTPTSPASGTLSQADELLVSAYCLSTGGTTTDVYTPEGGWTELSFGNSGGGSANKAAHGAYMVVASTSSETESGSSTTSGLWVGRILTYKIAGTPPPAGNAKRMTLLGVGP